MDINAAIEKTHADHNAAQIEVGLLLKKLKLTEPKQAAKAALALSEAVKRRDKIHAELDSLFKARSEAKTK